MADQIGILRREPLGLALDSGEFPGQFGIARMHLSGGRLERIANGRELLVERSHVVVALLALRS